MADRTCPVCGAPVVATRTGGKPQVYCGKACYSAAAIVRRMAQYKSRAKPGACCICRRELPRSYGEGSVCSEACRVVREDVRRVIEREGGPWVPIAYYDCPECGRLFVGRVRINRVYCTRQCASIATRRYYKHRRRTAARRGDRITIQLLGDRDGWVCHICKKRVTKKRSNDRAAPSIDHLIPISVGGDHTWSNVALAHKACNSRRHTGGVAQLRLS